MKQYKCVVVTPAGRKRYVEILLHYILKEKNFIDEYHIWMNTNNQDDINYFIELSKKFSFIKLKYNADKHPEKGKNWAIHTFFSDTIDNDTIYIRLDDDIVWLEDNFIEKLYYFRLNNPQYFLVYGNIINNAIIDHLLWRYGIYENSDIKNTEFKYIATDNNGWKDANVAYHKHKIFLDHLMNKKLDKYKFNKWILWHYERVSINCICWFGKHFKQFNGLVGRNEEVWLSVDRPKDIKTPNCIYGGAICSHYAFHTQRQHLEQTEILSLYKQLTQ